MKSNSQQQQFKSPVADSLGEKYTLVPTHMMPRIQESERSLKKKLARSNRDYVPLPTSASRQV